MALCNKIVFYVGTAAGVVVYEVIVKPIFDYLKAKCKEEMQKLIDYVEQNFTREQIIDYIKSYCHNLLLYCRQFCEVCIAIF